MEIKCEYCSGFFEDTLENCPHCGGINNNIRRVTDTTPKTIEELKKWYADRNLPPYETTRFFIGQNYTAPRAFGIYEENSEFIVYKNKDDGTRAIRYQGTDEAYAVNELYLKLKSEILNQKANNLNKGHSSRSKKKQSFGSMMQSVLSVLGIIVASIFVIAVNGLFGALAIGGGITLAVAIIFYFTKVNTKLGKKLWFIYIPIFLITTTVAFIPLHRYYTPKYFNYDNNVYCEYRGNFYAYDWYDYSPISYDALPPNLVSNMADYEYKWTDDEEWGEIYDFEKSNYYSENFASSSSDSDSSYDWDSGSSWDSGSTDWGSDW